jgi:DEAD/DEAH box helicase domain-containing protein
MIPSVLAAQLQQGVEDFLKTTFPVSTPFFHGIIDRLLSREEGVFKGPFLSLQLPFRMGTGKTDHFPYLTQTFAPYLHQERAFARLCGPAPKSTIIATGTGSGKTECFLYPILDHCYRHRGQPGIKAILIYPMNALATDQAGRLAGMICTDENLKGNVTAGLFVGQSEREPSMGMTANDIISHKDTIRNSPPDILLTNYKMLDYLLIRAKDFPLWQNNGPESLRYLVVDELHTFDGAQGTDLACLLRRLKARLGTPENHLCCVGTSATLGEKTEEKRLLDYAAEIFGEPIDEGGIISEYRVSAGDFLEKSLISQVDIVPLEKADLLVPEWHKDFSAYISAQHKLWFNETISPDEIKDGPWRIALCERLKSHLFFQNLLKVLGGRVRRLSDIIADLERVTPEFRSASGQYKENIIVSMVALVSSAVEEKNGNRAPFLHVRYHLWLRELRRMVGEVAAVPELRFADDLNDEQLKQHLPLVHCRECSSMGWAGVKRQQDSAVGTDLQTFYAAFFSNDPKVVFIFPEDAEPREIQADGQFYKLCSSCTHLTTQLSADDCPNCGQTDLIRVFIPNTRVARRNRRVGTHHCPYCGARNGLTILGSRAASLTSVLIAQLYASTFNDDKKLLAFSDSVQDAAHRAGFFTGRTYRFNLRGAIQQYIQEVGDGLRLDEISAGFIRHWRAEMDEGTFIATFLAPNMAWFADYEALKSTGKIPAGARLINDVQRRIEWEIYSEYGFRCRIGRTLEKTGSSIAYPDDALLENIVSACIDPLRNEISGLRALDEITLKRFILGVIVHLKHQGGLRHPVLDTYIESWGNTYQINLNVNWMPNFGTNSRTPAFLTTKRGNRFDPLFSPGSRRATWYEAWAEKCFAPIFPLITELIPPIYEIVLKALSTGGVLAEKRVRDERVWGIDPKALRISTGVVQLQCKTCGHEISVAANERDLWGRAPCLRFHCDGTYKEMAPVKDYYGELYAAGDIERIFAEEHTGLLDRDAREDLEACFKKKDRSPWDPNLLSCTPTLEMGIDIGDLSAVILCSVPPAQANYIQRIGRAGRRDGNALNLAVANARPHDLYFFAEPEEMLAGELDPPGVFLNASAVLERQFTAFCMDHWVETGISENAMPNQLRHVLGNLETVDPNKFPHNFLQFVDIHRTDLFEQFIKIFVRSLSDDSITHLKHFVKGQRDRQGSLSYRIVDGLYFHFKERESLKKKVTSLNAQIRKKKASPVKDQHHQQQLDELVREKSALQSLVTRINDRHTLQFFTDEGLIPNYAFPEAGVLLRSIIYRRKKTPREGESNYDTFSFDYERPAVSAISELAPENNFYAGSRKVRVDQVDLTVSEIETWRFCTNCACHGLVGKTAETRTCPQCGSAMWADGGQKRQMIRLRQVFATTSDKASRISDDSDDRDPTFYNKQMMISYNEADITDAYMIDSDELPFGLEFLKRVSLREINFGEKDDFGENLTIAGVESPRKGFVICKHCGKVQNRRHEIQHTLWCHSRKKESENNLTECVYLYREFSSEAIQMLLPVTTFEGSDRKLHSFIAALHLGLKQIFGGNIDHLQTAVHEEPVPNSTYRKKYLVLYDTVPGGTGYLKQLMRSEKPLLQVLEVALEILKACPCNQDARKDGCYKCLYAYRRSYNMAGTSREAAKEMLAGILEFKDKMTRTKSLKGVQVNALFDSELEARFIEALRRVRINNTPAKLTKEVVNGKPGYFYKIGDKTYYIELQVSLGAADGVAVPSKADFMFRPARIQDGIKPLAVYTDGFAYHKARIGLDMAQRCAIAHSGKFHVWSISWKDLENQYKQQGSYFRNYLAIKPNGQAANYNRLLDSYKVEKLLKLNDTDSFAWLIRFLSDPDEKKWQYHAFVHGLLHLDNKRFAADEEKKAWMDKLQETFPEEIAQRTGELEPPCFYGLYEPQTHDNFLKLFVAIDQKALQKGKTAGMRTAWCLLDSPSEQDTPGFEAAWNGYLRCHNLFQFLKHSFFSTKEGKASEQPYGPFKQDGETPETQKPDEWLDVKAYTDAKFHGLIDQLAQHGWTAPEVGFELDAENGAIIGEAELAWIDLKVALLDQDHLEFREAFVSSGWRIFDIEAVLAEPETFLKYRDNHG